MATTPAKQVDQQATVILLPACGKSLELNLDVFTGLDAKTPIHLSHVLVLTGL